MNAACKIDLSPTNASAVKGQNYGGRPVHRLCSTTCLTLQSAGSAYAAPEGSGKVRGYLVRPAAGTGKLPCVLVVHENRGLNPHIEDIARRLALDGFLAFAPDALTPLGGYPGDEDKARDLFAKLDQNKSRNDFLAGERFLKAMPESNGEVGVVGFCYGGGVANFPATKIADLGAACRSTVVSRVPKKRHGSRHRCWCSTPRRTSASMPAGQPTRQP